MFRSVHTLTVDTKGRLQVPMRHQTQINAICSEKIVLSKREDISTEVSQLSL